MQWRAWIGAYVIAALALPALGPLPWLLGGTGGDAHIVAHHDAHEHAGHVHHHSGDRSDVPGSPTHPVDHECLACQVLAQLGRSCEFAAPLALEPHAITWFNATLHPEAPILFSSGFSLTPPARAPPVATA